MPFFDNPLPGQLTTSSRETRKVVVDPTRLTANLPPACLVSFWLQAGVAAHALVVIHTPPSLAVAAPNTFTTKVFALPGSITMSVTARFATAVWTVSLVKVGVPESALLET